MSRRITFGLLIAVCVAAVTVGASASSPGQRHDDTNVALLVVRGDDGQGPAAIPAPVSTTQVDPAILAFLGLSPHALEAVREEHTPALPAGR